MRLWMRWGLLVMVVVGLVGGYGAEARQDEDDFWVVFRSQRCAEDGDCVQLYTMRSDGSDVRPLTQTEDGFKYTEFEIWSPDGEWIIFSGFIDPDVQGLYRVHFQDGQVEYLIDWGPDDEIKGWSPDNEWLIFNAYRNNQVDIFRIRGDGSEVQNLTDEAPQDLFVSWFPNGERMVFTKGLFGEYVYYSMLPDGADVKPLFSEAGDQFNGWSPDGEWMYFTRGDRTVSDLYRIHLVSGEIQQLTNDQLGYHLLDWTPDGEWMIVRAIRTSESLIYMQPDGSQAHNLGPAGPCCLISPNSEWLYFVNRSTLEGYQVQFGSDDLIQTSDEIGTFISWTPDGNGMIFWTADDISVASLDGTEIYRLADSLGLITFSIYSPDGMWLYLEGGRRGPTDIYRMNMETYAIEQLTDLGGRDQFLSFYPPMQGN